jgi:hypothetical protein
MASVVSGLPVVRRLTVELPRRAFAGSRLAVGRRPRSILGGAFSIGRCALSIVLRAQQDLLPVDPAIRHVVAKARSLIAFLGGEIAQGGGGVPIRRGHAPRRADLIAATGGFGALSRHVPPRLRRARVRLGVGPGREPGVGGSLVRIRAELVTVAQRLIAVRRGLITITARLVVMRRAGVTIAETLISVVVVRLGHAMTIPHPARTTHRRQARAVDAASAPRASVVQHRDRLDGGRAADRTHCQILRRPVALPVGPGGPAPEQTQ